MWFVNLVNFMDGLDWMTVAEVVPITAALAMIGAFGLLPPAETIISFALCGAMIGFAYFNRPVARLSSAMSAAFRSGFCSAGYWCGSPAITGSLPRSCCLCTIWPTPPSR